MCGRSTTSTMHAHVRTLDYEYHACTCEDARLRVPCMYMCGRSTTSTMHVDVRTLDYQYHACTCADARLQSTMHAHVRTLVYKYHACRCADARLQVPCMYMCGRSTTTMASSCYSANFFEFFKLSFSVSVIF